MDPKEQLAQVTNLLTPLVEGTDANQLDNETPCSDFRVRDLIGHFTFGRFLFAAGMSGDKSRGDELLGSMPQQFGDVLGDDHHATYRDASAQLDTAVGGRGRRAGSAAGGREATGHWAQEVRPQGGGEPTTETPTETAGAQAWAAGESPPPTKKRRQSNPAGRPNEPPPKA